MDGLENDEMNDKKSTMESNSPEKIIGNGVSEKAEKPQSPDNVMRGMSETNVRERIEKLRNEVDGMMTEVMKDLEGFDKFNGAYARRLDDAERLYSDKRKRVESGILPEKEFIRRNSVLTDLYEIKHFRTIYNIFVMILIVILLHTVIHDVLHTGSVYLGWKLVWRGFAKLSIVIEVWLMMLVSTFAVYSCFNYWAQRRTDMTPKSIKRKVWDSGWLVLFVVYQITLLILPAQIIIWENLPPISRVIILTETVRMAMKMHAYVRSVAPVVLSYKPHSDDEQLKLPDFSTFLYFHFAPTLIYRETYPRTTEIRWRFVLWHLFEVVLVIFNMAFIFERHLIPPFEEFGKHPFELRSFVLSIYGTFFPSILVFVSGFYCLLHAWMNAAAEVTRFGDRLFYKDWWNSTTYGTFYKRWNVVVHDWLYTYIYKDIYEIVMPGNRFIPAWTVFFVSALFHEYIIGVAFHLFLPMMLVQFGIIGFLLVFLRLGKSWGNIFLWFSLCTGSGLMISFYSIEYFARVNCPKRLDGLTDLFLPRSYTCL
ncbi:sterol O-acyltransferase 1 [Venturia canescens]|uniref:sterol O-acyltransferase 1 n=1 Tax=Venturia canescens TaxID=32260 RepID=UPI001C9CAA29|nr:sterol O-acyltransferase 1 [Venturia canescens]XP_043268458.1 sterol O-acyltransferase 1 [Venturia canescens]XP_043268459.1 sterol O-acyltransferase 1 [Venturia canescens]